MLFIIITKIEYTGGDIGIMLIIEITKLKLFGGHAIAKIIFMGGHIGFMLIIEIAKIE